MSFGSDESGGYNAFSKAFKSNPTLENYLRIRRENPRSEVEVAVLGGFDSVLSMQTEFEAHGISMSDMMGVLDADDATISKMSLFLIEQLLHRQNLKNQGETHIGRLSKAIPLKLIDWIIALMLEALSWTDSMQMNRDLIVLINARLVGNGPHYRLQVQAYENRHRATWLGAQLIARGEDLSLRKVAQYLGLSASTISRWFESDQFESECERLSGLFNSDGSMKKLSELDIKDAPPLE